MVAEWRWQSSTSRPARQPLKAVNFREKAGWLVWSGLVGEPEGLLLLAASAHWFKMGKISQKLVHLLWFHEFWSNKFHLIDIISVSGGYMHFIFKNLSNCWWHKYDPSIPRVFFLIFGGILLVGPTVRQPHCWSIIILWRLVSASHHGQLIITSTNIRNSIWGSRLKPALTCRPARVSPEIEKQRISSDYSSN